MSNACVPRELKEKVRAVCGKYGWSDKKALKKITEATFRGRFIAGDSLEKAADFLLNPPAADAVICDGCNVRGNWEHRCHGSRARVRDVIVGKPCQCPECFVADILGLI